MMHKRAIVIGVSAAVLSVVGCGQTDTRDQVVYPYTKPIPRAAEYRGPAQHSAPPASKPVGKKAYTSCPGDAEELAPGSICPPTAKCYDISGGKRCIDYAK